MGLMNQHKVNGVVNYKSLLSVYNRLPAMYAKYPDEVITVLSVALFSAFESMNLVRPMNEDQILELAETIADSSSEDYLALEDVVMFLQGLIRGKYGQLYESMDIPKFMEKFELYRLERHKTMMNFRDENHSQLKGMGISERESDNADREKELQHSALVDYMSKHFKDGERI